jgi:hypothetical protein
VKLGERIMKRALRLQEIALCLVRKWWRPVTCVGIAGGTVVNLVVIPLKTWTVPNLAEGAAWIGACAAAFAVREVGKAWGTASDA